MRTEPLRKDQKHPLCYDPRCDIHTTPKTNVALKAMFPRCSQSFIEANTEKPVQVNVERKKANYETNHQRKIQDSEPQPHAANALDGVATGEKGGDTRVRVRFTGHRVRPLDPDNFAGSCKDLLDGLRHSGLLAGDEPWRIIFETAQEKVKSYAEERTVIEIDL